MLASVSAESKEGLGRIAKQRDSYLILNSLSGRSLSVVNGWWVVELTGSVNGHQQGISGYSPIERSRTD